MARAKLHKSLMTLKEFNKEYGKAFGDRTGEAYENYMEGLAGEVGRALDKSARATKDAKRQRKYLRLIGTDVRRSRYLQYI